MRFNELAFWQMAFCSICSFRFHPKDDSNSDIVGKVKFSAEIADLMLDEYRKRAANRTFDPSSG